MDIIDIALAKNFAKKMAAGFTNVEVDGMTINFTLIDGSTISLTVPTPADGVSVTDLEIDENGDLICSMSDGTEINAGKALPQKGIDYFTTEDIEEIENEIVNSVQNNIDIVQEEVDLLKTNFNKNTPTISDYISINDSINGKVENITLIGKTEQNTYIGKNKFGPAAFSGSNYDLVFSNEANSSEININGTSTNTGNANSKISGVYTLPAGTYTVYVEGLNENDRIGIKDTSAYAVSQVKNKTPKTFTTTQSMDVYASMVVSPSTVYNGIIKIQIEPGEEYTGYEPYVGETASPNPDYTQPLQNIKGDVVTESSNENLFDAPKIVRDTNNDNVYITQDNKEIRYSLGSNRVIIKPCGGTKSNQQYTYVLIVRNPNDSAKVFKFNAYYADGSFNTIINQEISDKEYHTLTGTTSVNKTLSYVTNVSTSSFAAYIKIEGSQIREGVTITDYIKHRGKSITFPLSQGQKMYEGDFLANDGIHHVRKQVDMGTLSYSYASNYDYFYTTLSNVKNTYTAGDIFEAKSTAYLPTSTTASGSQ